MEWIKRMSLKKSLFVLTLSGIVIAALLSALFFWACIEFHVISPPQGVMFHVNEGYIIEPESFTNETQQTYAADLLSLSQIVLPVLFFAGALLAAVILFYRWKLKEPLAVLAHAAARIMKNDLDFSVASPSSDELGALCDAFEMMRGALLTNNQKLWRQTEEQKRLNAAFSHDLRNPLTVLKGSVKLARRCAPDDEMLPVHLDRIETYTMRLERYVEIMSSTGRLEQMPLEPAPIDPCQLSSELGSALRLLAASSKAQFSFHGIVCSPHSAHAVYRPRIPHSTDIAYDGDSSHRTVSAPAIYADKNVIFQIAENLVANALRFAKENVSADFSLTGDRLTLRVTDDGSGFPAKLLKSRIRPFQKGVEDASHFGMGLYICELLCEKHGGTIEIGNLLQGGAWVQAVLDVGQRRR